MPRLKFSDTPGKKNPTIMPKLTQQMNARSDQTQESQNDRKSVIQSNEQASAALRFYSEEPEPISLLPFLFFLHSSQELLPRRSFLASFYCFADFSYCHRSITGYTDKQLITAWFCYTVRTKQGCNTWSKMVLWSKGSIIHEKKST